MPGVSSLLLLSAKQTANRLARLFDAFSSLRAITRSRAERGADGKPGEGEAVLAQCANLLAVVEHLELRDRQDERVRLPHRLVAATRQLSRLDERGLTRFPRP